MRELKPRDKTIQITLALILLLPLLGAFLSSGGVTDLNSAPQTSSMTSGHAAILIRAASQSLCLGLTSAAVAALLGIPAAWALSTRKLSTFKAVLTVLPLALPAPVAISGWVRLIAPNATSSFALQLPGSVQNWTSSAHALLFSPVGAGLVLGFNLWPIVALNAWPGFVRARDSSFDAARLYASPARVFFRTALPRCKGEIFAGVALVFLLASNDFAVSSLLLVNTLTVQIHDQAALGKNAAAAWASLPLVFIAGVICLFVLKKTRFSSGASSGNVASIARPSKIAAATFYAGVLGGFAIPTLGCLYGVLSSGKALSVSFDAGAGSMGLSARLAVAAVLISSALAVLRVLAWPEQRAGMLSAAGIFLVAMPGAFIGISFLALQIKATRAASFFQMPLAWMAVALALRFVYVPLRLADEALASIDPALTESAALLGHSRSLRAFSIVLPLSAGHLAAAAALVFTLGLGEVPIASILAPPGAVPATIWLFGQQHMGYDESVYALSLLLGATTAGAIAIGVWVAKWVQR